MWFELEKISSTVSQPWLGQGDFNTLLNTSDRIRGQGVSKGLIRDFKIC